MPIRGVVEGPTGAGTRKQAWSHPPGLGAASKDANKDNISASCLKCPLHRSQIFEEVFSDQCYHPCRVIAAPGSYNSLRYQGRGYPILMVCVKRRSVI